MKKKLLGTLAALLTVSMMAGCGSGTDNTQGTQETQGTQGTQETQETQETQTGKQPTVEPLKDVDVDQYVTLGDYMGLEVSISPISVDEVQLEELVRNAYAGRVTLENGGVTDRPVEEGDTVIIDYEGKKDGVAFEGGTAQGSSLTIGSGAFIPGFEEGLIGVMPGETVDLDITFPEGYGNAELAGQPVVFTVTVNYIIPEELEDAVVEGFGVEGITTVDELREDARSYLYSNAEITYNSSLQNLVMEAFIGNCTFQEMPADRIAQYEEPTRQSLEQYAAQYGMDVDTYTTAVYQTDAESFISTYAEQAVKEDMALQAVANRENLNIDDEELNSLLEEQMALGGFASVEELVGDTSLEDYRQYFLYNKVIEFLIENAVITEV